MTDPTREQLRSARDSGELARHLAVLVSITQEFAASLDIGQTLKTTAERICELLDAEASSLFLLETRGGNGGGEKQLVCRACSGPIDITGLRLNIHQGIVGKTIRNKHPLMVRDVHTEPDFAQSVDRSTGFVTRSILSVPLRVKDHCLGALELINKKSGDGLFDQRDKELSMALAASAALAIHNARMATALVEQERQRHELELARVVQRSLLPATGPATGAAPHAGPGSGLIAGLNIPAHGVSGDFFDYMSLDDGRISFNIADVAGKGMDAALLMAKTSSLLRCLGKQETHPGKLLARVNEELCETAIRGKFVTVVAGILDPRSGLVYFANAGHQPPLLHQDNDKFIELTTAAPPLGILPGIDFPTTELYLGNSALYLFTDGLTEARNDQGDMVGESGVRQAIREFSSWEKYRRLRAIAGKISGNGSRQNDDITLLVVETSSTTLRESRTTEPVSR
jgi:sigma-B regulation protein RsbU (phosphoserine phosphatase)